MYDSIKADINNVCLSNNHSCGSFYDHIVYRINVVNAIQSLCAGKSNGEDDISSGNLKHATDIFIDYIGSLFYSIWMCTYKFSFVYHNTHTKKITPVHVISIDASKAFDHVVILSYSVFYKPTMYAL